MSVFDIFIIIIILPGLQDRSQDFLLNAAIIPSKREYSGESTRDEVELPLFDFSTIAIATENFSDQNKLGQGGFGCVYKVLLLLLQLNSQTTVSILTASKMFVFVQF